MTNFRPSDLPSRIALSILRLLAGRKQGLSPLKPRDLRRVLLIRYDRLGDMVITTPVIEALRRIAPHVEIDVLASNANRAIIESDPRVSKVWIWSRSLAGRIRLIRDCRARRYDAVFQFIYARTTLPAIFAGLVAPKGRTVGKYATDHDFLFNHSIHIPHVHFKERTFLLLEALDLGEPLPDLPYSIHIPESERVRGDEVLRMAGLEPRSFIMQNISAGDRFRELSIEQSVGLARALGTLGYRVAIIGAPDAAERAKEIAEESGAVALRFPSLLALAAAMESARLVVTADTGTLHVASAVKVPVVGMFHSMGTPDAWGPRGVECEIVPMNEFAEREKVSIDEVMEAARELLGRTGDC